MLGNLILETTNAPGTSADCLLNGPAAGRLGFSSWFTSGSACFYVLNDGTQQEWGVGTYTAGSPNKLTRTTVLKNSAGSTARLNFLGSTRVYNETPAERSLWIDNSNNVNFPAGIAVASLDVYSPSARFALHDTDAAFDQKIYDFVSDSGQLSCRAVNDAYSAANNWLNVTRSGYTIGTITLSGTQINLNGPVTVFGALFTNGAVGTSVASVGNVRMEPGSATNPGFVSFWNAAGTRVGYAGYSDGSNHLQLFADDGFTGWTTNGSFNVGGTLTAGDVWSNSAFHLNSGAFFYSDADNTYLNMDTGNWRLVYDRHTGTLYYLRGGDSVTLFSIDGSGQLSAATRMSAPYIYSTGDVRADARLYCNDIMCNSGTFYIAGNYAYYLARNGTDGNWRFVDNNIVNFTVAADGNVSARAGVFGTYVQSSGAVWAGTSMRVMGVGSNWSYWGSSNYIGWSWNNTNLDVYVDYTFIGNFPSDERLKTIIGPYERGLAELRRIDPILYRLKGNDRGIAPDADTQKELNDGPSIRDTNKIHVGFVAQRVEGAFPELVQRRPAVIDGEVVNDVRYVDDGPWLTFAMVNAMKEMDARLAALTEANAALVARIAALEAKGAAT